MDTPNVDEVMRTAYSYYERGLFDEAIAEWRNALRLDPSLAEAHYDIGYVLDEQGRAEEALSEWREATRIRPEYRQAHKAIATRCFVTASKSRSALDWSVALAAYREVAEYTPHDARMLSDIGSIEWYLGDRKAAEKSLKTAIRVDPTFINAHRKLIRLYKEQGKWANVWRAASILARLPEFDPGPINMNYKELFRGIILPLTIIAAIVVLMQKDPKAI